MTVAVFESDDSIMGLANDVRVFSKAVQGKELALGLRGEEIVLRRELNNKSILDRIEKEMMVAEKPIEIVEYDKVREIAAGTHHAIGFTWGADQIDWLEINGIKDICARNYVKPGERNTMINEGDEFSIAVTSSGRVYTWGKNAYYCRSNVQSLINTSPVDSFSIKNLKKIVIDGLSCMALDNNGNVWTWGNNTNNRLGRNELNSNDGLKPGIIEQHAQVQDIGFDRNFYVIDEQGKRMDIMENNDPL